MTHIFNMTTGVRESIVVKTVEGAVLSPSDVYVFTGIPTDEYRNTNGTLTRKFVDCRGVPNGDTTMWVFESDNVRNYVQGDYVRGDKIEHGNIINSHDVVIGSKTW